MTDEELWKKIERGLSNLTPSCQLNFGVQIVEHCNLNCKQCNHFSPVAEEEYLDVNSFKRDCDRLSELFDGEMTSMTLTGGEPLLHPQIIDFMRIAREAFPVGKIMLMTNGLLLPTMPESFLDACRKYEVVIETTCYPVKFDYAGFEKIAESKGVEYIPFDLDHYTQQKTYPILSKVHSRQVDSGICRRNFLNCGIAHCTGLKKGRLYPCPLAYNAPHLIKHFNLDIRLSEKDGVDIYSVKTGEELLAKLSRPIPFCLYCDVTDKSITCDWGISKKDRYEWLTFAFTEDDIQYLKSKKHVVYVFGAGRWGERTVNLLKNQGIDIKRVLTTRKKQGIDNIQGVPIATLDELESIEQNSICLVALESSASKSEVYPLLSKIGFGDVVPISGLNY